MDFLSHPMTDFREAAVELARTDRVLKQSSQNRFAKIGHLLQMSTTGCPRVFPWVSVNVQAGHRAEVQGSAP